MRNATVEAVSRRVTGLDKAAGHYSALFEHDSCRLCFANHCSAERLFPLNIT
jgi:hypothetical protein